MIQILERDADIRSKRATGRPITSIGREYGLCYERVRQICKGVVLPPKIREVRHGTPSEYGRGCRCDLCRQAIKQVSRKCHDNLVQMFKSGTYMPRHGVGGYSVGCRCEVCRSAMSACSKRGADALKKRVAEGDPTVRHGRLYVYSVGGCRCGLCRKANHGISRKSYKALMKHLVERQEASCDYWNQS